jgi:hypothetical protein
VKIPTMIAVALVTVALILYTIGTFAQQRSRRVTGSAVGFLTAGLVFDVVATIFMIIGSGKLISLHGILGYSALAGMLAEVVVAWRWRLRGAAAPITPGMVLYSRLAYGYWVLAFISGGALVAMSRRAAEVAQLGMMFIG